MDRLSYIANSLRRTGSSTFILKAAINNPNVVIVYGCMEIAERFKREYFKMLKGSIWYKRLFWNLFGRDEPVFTSLDCDDIASFKLPVVFDGSALLVKDK